MNVGIVTTWFERGAAYVSKIFEDVLSNKSDINVYIYARGGEEYGIGNPIWDRENVYWGKRIISPFSSTVIHKKDFIFWVQSQKIEVIIFNEQHWFQPLLWCKELGIKTIAYIDYYTEETIPLFEIYDCVICNTNRHYTAFRNHNNVAYLPWGTFTNVFKATNQNLVNDNYVTFFHSCGWDTYRKGTDLLLKAYKNTINNSKLIIHTQNDIKDLELLNIIEELKKKNRIEIITKTVHAPGLFHLGDVYVYPSRLEGIGLTIAESISSGLAVVVPNAAPMNEFAYKENSRLIEVDKFFSRSDGYYWPMNEIKIENLTQILDELAAVPDSVREMKLASRNIAEKFLDVEKNFQILPDIIRNVKFNKSTETIIQKINNYDNKGFRRFHGLYLTLYPLFNTLRKFLKQ